MLGVATENLRTTQAGVVRGASCPSSVELIEHLIVLHGSIGEGTSESILVDSGATSNFVTSEFVKRHALCTTSLQQKLEVRMANGELELCDVFVRNVKVSLGKYDGEHNFVVLPSLDGFDAILGRAFLVKARAVVDHCVGSVSLGGGVSASAHAAAKRVKVAKPTSQSAVFSSMVAAVVEGLDEPSQDVVLRALGLAAVASEEAVTRAAVATEIFEAVMRFVDAYAIRMQPLIGQLPPCRGPHNHTITPIHKEVRPVKRRAIPLNDRHQKALAAELEKLLDAGSIRVSRSEWAAPVFFVPKNDEEDRMVCDYRGLNAVTETNSASLPYLKELFARLKDAVIFSKLDLKSGYHQLRVRESDIPLTAFITPHGHFEWVVMPFGEKNAAASFAELMNQLVLRDLVHTFVIAFQDDMLIASKSDEEHPGHVEQVLQRLSDHQLWIKPQKCAWAVREVDFLGHHLRASALGTVIEPMQSKVEAVANWPIPATTAELRSFLGLANFYRDFVQGFSSLAAPLTALTGQRVPFMWSEQHQNSFVSLKSAMCSAPALLAVDDSKPFVMHCDASCFAVGAVLSQRDEVTNKLRPVGFFSRKLSDTQLRWDVYEREIYSVVAALEHWHFHVKGTSTPVQIFTDHRSLEELGRQLLRPKMARWLTFLSDFNYQVTWIPADQNRAADALSRRPDHDEGSVQRRVALTAEAQQLHTESGNSLGPGLPMSSQQQMDSHPTAIRRTSSATQSLSALSPESVTSASLLTPAQPEQCAALAPSSTPATPLVPATPAQSARPGEALLHAVAVAAFAQPMHERIKQAYLRDEECRVIMDDPAKHGYLIRDGLLLRHVDRGILVPADPQLRLTVLREAHDQPTSSHLGVAKTLARLAGSFYWPAGMSRDVAEHIARCGPCQRNKHSNQRPAGLMKPLPIVGKGEMITIDFVGELPRSRRGKDAILVVVDKMTKRAYYEPCTTTATAKQTAEMIFRRVVREQGLPVSIISDRDTRFTSRVWRELWTLCGTELGIATSYHQQTGGQSERQVRTLEESLRMFVNAAGNDWDERLVHVEIAHNTACHASTGFAPLRLHSGIDAKLPVSMVSGDASLQRTPSSAQDVLARMSDDIETARESLKIAQDRQKRAYDNRHRVVRYAVGDLAYINTTDTIHNDGGKTVWRPRFEGPYYVREVSDDGLNVTLDIPKSRRHPVFHVTKLKRASMPLNAPLTSLLKPGCRRARPKSSDLKHRVPVGDKARPASEPREDVTGDRYDQSHSQVTWVSDVDDWTGAVNVDDASDGRQNDAESHSESEEETQAIVQEEHSEDSALSERRDEISGDDADASSSDGSESDASFTEVRRGSRRRFPPVRLIHDGRLGDQFGLNLAELSLSWRKPVSSKLNQPRSASKVTLTNRFQELALS